MNKPLSSLLLTLLVSITSFTLPLHAAHDAEQEGSVVYTGGGDRKAKPHRQEQPLPKITIARTLAPQHLPHGVTIVTHKSTHKKAKPKPIKNQLDPEEQEEWPEELEEDLKALGTLSKDQVKDAQAAPPLLMGCILAQAQGGQNTYHKYLLSNQGKIPEGIVRTAQHQHFHLVQTTPSHIGVALLQLFYYWQTKEPPLPLAKAWGAQHQPLHPLHIAQVALRGHQVLHLLACSGPICSHCHYILTDLLGYQGPLPEPQPQGCAQAPWAKLPAPAQAYANHCLLTLQDPLGGAKKALAHLDGTHYRLQQQLAAHKQMIATKDHEIASKDQTITTLQRRLQETEQTLNELLAQQPPKKEEEEQKEESNTPAPDIYYALTTFDANLQKYKIKGGEWYQKTARQEIAGLQAAYALVQQPKWEQEIDQLAQEWADFPRMEGNHQIWTKYDYLAVKTVWLKRQLPQQVQSKLICTSENNANQIANKYCWSHGPHRNRAQAPQEERLRTAQGTPDFAGYLRAFQQGLQAYDVKKSESWTAHNYGWYAASIEKELKGLQKAYPKLANNAARKEAENIAYELALCRKFERFDLLFHYMQLQNRLLELTISVGNMAKNDIVYTNSWKQQRYLFASWKHG